MPTQAPPPQEYGRVLLIIILLFFLYTSPDQPPPPGFNSPRDYAAERVSRLWHSLDILNRTHSGDFDPVGPAQERGVIGRYLNLTGFREDDEYAWERLEGFKKRSGEFSEEAKLRRGVIPGEEKVGEGMVGMVYENVTGVVNGRWVRYEGDLYGEQRTRDMNLTEISPGVEWAFRNEELWTRNITGKEGKLRMRIDEGNVKQMEVPLSDAEGLGPVPVEEAMKSATWATELVKEVGATVVIQDESSSGDGWEMKVHGVHWPRQGVMMMTTTSDKFAGIFGLPHLTPNADYFTTSQKLLNGTLEKVVQRMEKALWADPGNPWSATPDNQGDSTMPIPHCEFVVYVQLYPLKIDQGVRGGYIHPLNVPEIEQELRFPNGAPIDQVPDLQMSTVMFSPDCGFMLESKGPPTFSPVDGEHLVGVKQEMFIHSISSWLHIFALVIFAQILLLKTQSKEASTPSTIGRVSLYTVAMMLMADALLFVSMSLLSATVPNVFPATLLLSFAGLMSVALGMRFIGAIYNVQEPERRERMRVQDAADQAARAANRARFNPSPVYAPVITAAGADVAAPPPTTTASAPPTDLPIIIPSDQDIDAEITENTTSTPSSAPLLPTTNPTTTTTTPPPPRSPSNFGSVYIKFVLTLMLILFISLSSSSWSLPFRTFYVNTLSFLYLSMWLPQIRRNILRNCRKALLWKFVVGQSFLRLLPFAYFYLREDNILFATTDWKAFCVLAGWVWFQIWILAAQEILGPRWGLPKNWTDQGWDYHPILREDALESGGLPIGLMQTPSAPTSNRTSEDQAARKKRDGGNLRTVDCAICMQVIEVPVVPAGGDGEGGMGGVERGVQGMLMRRQYMVTPCRHVFHSACLEGWMRFRLQCPIDREDLPPI